MAERMVLLASAEEGPWWWVISGADGGSPQAESGALELAAARAQGKRVTLLLPSRQVLLTAVDLPGRNHQRLMQAMPYALEDQLADEVDELFFVLGPRGADGKLPVAVVARQVLDSWLDRLAGVGIQAAVVLPEALAVPWDSGQWSVWVGPGRVLVRRARFEGFETTLESLSVLVKLAWAEAIESPPTRIRVLLEETAELPELDEDLPWEVRRSGLPALTDLSRGLSEKGAEALNLLQGDYSAAEQLGRLLRPWRAAAALLLVALLIQGVMQWVEVRDLRQQRQQLSARVEQVFRETFPEVKNLVNPRVQMERRLAKLRQGGAGGGGGPLTLLARIGGPLTADASVVLNNISFKEDRLDLDLTLPDLQKLDGLKQRLSKAAGREVEVVTATQKGGQVKARMRIRGGLA